LIENKKKINLSQATRFNRYLDPSVSTGDAQRDARLMFKIVNVKTNAEITKRTWLRAWRRCATFHGHGIITRFLDDYQKVNQLHETFEQLGVPLTDPSLTRPQGGFAASTFAHRAAVRRLGTGNQVEEPVSPISPSLALSDQQIQSLTYVFRRVDQQQRGLIDLEELARLNQFLKGSVPWRIALGDARQFLSAADREGNGELTLPQWIAGWKRATAAKGHAVVEDLLFAFDAAEKGSKVE
jgi:hypothetical protein